MRMELQSLKNRFDLIGDDPKFNYALTVAERVASTDVSVLGGVRVELEGRQLDGTVRGRLSGISRKLNEVMV